MSAYLAELGVVPFVRKDLDNNISLKNTVIPAVEQGGAKKDYSSALASKGLHQDDIAQPPDYNQHTLESLEIDLLVLVAKPKDASYQELLSNILASINLVNQSILYTVCHDLEFLHDPYLFQQNHNIIFKKLLIFDKDANFDLKCWCSNYNLNDTDILFADTLESMSKVTSMKKKLWLDLKRFL